jgi:hypothetical protein
MAKVDESDVDGDFLSLARLFPQPGVCLCLWSILIYHPHGWYMDGKFTVRNKKFAKMGKTATSLKLLDSDTEPLVRSAHGLRLVYRIFGHQVKRLDHE